MKQIYQPLIKEPLLKVYYQKIANLMNRNKIIKQICLKLSL
jgi:hypothetical protein